MAGEAIQAVRGMKDILPAQAGVWQRVEQTIQRIFAAYGYHEIRLPIVEKTELFKRTIGEETDIVAKEMYTFEDRNGDSLTLRPEGTAGCVRAAIENGLLYRAQHRVWYLGPMFRHERPQRGRYRQFHQAGVEAFGWSGPDIDIELIAMCARVFAELGLADLELQINSLASTEARAAYRAQLMDFLNEHIDKLDRDSQQRLHTNPLRVLDSKDPQTREVLALAPDLRDSWDEESAKHFSELRDGLTTLGIRHTVNTRLVRGLDYYNRTVFEWISPKLGAQGTVCAGGRYDGLVQQLGSKQTVPAAGFAIGLERLVELCEQTGLVNDHALDAYVIMGGAATRDLGLKVAEQLRNLGYTIEWHCGDEGMKSQFKKANKSGARLALVIGEDEFSNSTITIKPLRSERQQATVPIAELEKHFADFLGTS